ncbi:MAG: 3-hydroxybutyrate oligomer hydrolase family protein [Arenimonas sp.]|jgi:hydroxybutyrate-dimer hydrolase
MSQHRLTLLLPLTAIVALTACASSPARGERVDFLVSEIEQHAFSGDDDLLTGGLNADGLKRPTPPAFADPAQPTPTELRRRAIWSNWRGIADLAPGGAYGEVYGSLQPVPGREYHALAKLPGASQPHRVMVQVPDGFDAGKRCIVVSASSGSRGIYGAIALAGSWGLAHGCAVAYTDKGAGTGYVDTATGRGAKLDGIRAAEGDVTEFSTAPIVRSGPAPIATKHAHSQDNPEAEWGRHVKQAAEFALQVLASARPDERAFTFANTRVIAVGVSNGGGAVLRAAELPGEWLDGVVAISPNIHSGQGGRALYDYTTEAALYLPCALNSSAFDAVAMARPGGSPPATGAIRCASLHGAGLLQADSAEQQAEEARAVLLAYGWTDAALGAAALSTGLDLWRAVAVTYSSSYARTTAADMPCGYSFQAVDGSGAVRASSVTEQAAWWSDASGIPPGAGVGIRDQMASGIDASFPGLQCLRGLWQDSGDVADKARASIAATRSGLPRPGLPVLVMHGADDGLIPAAFTGAAYARWAKAEGRNVRYWQVANAQHFDAFLGLPAMASKYLPMLPYAYHGLDAMWAHLADGKPLPGDAQIATIKRGRPDGTSARLAAENLGQLP